MNYRIAIIDVESFVPLKMAALSFSEFTGLFISVVINASTRRVTAINSIILIIRIGYGFVSGSKYADLF